MSFGFYDHTIDAEDTNPREPRYDGVPVAYDGRLSRRGK